MILEKYQKRKKIIAFFLIIVFLGIALLFQEGIKNCFYTISLPFQKFFLKQGTKISNFFSSFGKLKELREKIDSLEKENYSLSLQIANLKELEIENRELKKALDLNLQKEFNLVLAEVSGKDIGTKDTILITAGKRDGVLEDMPVITPEKILVGKVVKSYKNFSEVALLSKKNFSFDVKIKSKEEQNKKDISAIAKGEGNSEISLDLVPLTAPVSKDDIIISDNMGKIFPKGLLVGYIKDIKKSDTAVFQKIKAQHIFDIKKQRTLFVITGYKE